MLSGLYFQEDLRNYTWSYCRNTLAGQVVTQALPSSLTAAMPLNLNGGNGVNSTFPSLVSYYASNGFIAANPGPTSASVVAWCCDTDNCNKATIPLPPPPSPPPRAPTKNVKRSSILCWESVLACLMSSALILL